MLAEIERITEAMDASPASPTSCWPSTTQHRRHARGAPPGGARRTRPSRCSPFRRNGGSGTARRIGTQRARGEIVVWTDADMTYPNERIPELVADAARRRPLRPGRRRPDSPRRARTSGCGCRPSGSSARSPSGCRTRRSPTSTPACARSGARWRCPTCGCCPPGSPASRRSRWRSCPTSTTSGTCRSTTRKRAGTSKFHFVRDAYRYILQVLRMVMYFDPLKVLMPPALWLIVIGVVKAVVDMVRHPFYFPASTVLHLPDRAHHRVAWRCSPTSSCAPGATACDDRGLPRTSGPAACASPWSGRPTRTRAGSRPTPPRPPTSSPPRVTTSTLVSWSRLYPDRLYPGEQAVPDGGAGPPAVPRARSGRCAGTGRCSWWRTGATLRDYDLVVIVVVVPVQVPALLALVARGSRPRPAPAVRAPGQRVVVLAHNVVPHETHPGGEWLMTRMLARGRRRPRPLAPRRRGWRASTARRRSSSRTCPPHLPGGVPAPSGRDAAAARPPLRAGDPLRVLALGIVRALQGLRPAARGRPAGPRRRR